MQMPLRDDAPAYWQKSSGTGDRRYQDILGLSGELARNAKFLARNIKKDGGHAGMLMLSSPTMKQEARHA